MAGRKEEGEGIEEEEKEKSFHIKKAIYKKKSCRFLKKGTIVKFASIFSFCLLIYFSLSSFQFLLHIFLIVIFTLFFICISFHFPPVLSLFSFTSHYTSITLHFPFLSLPFLPLFVSLITLLYLSCPSLLSFYPQFFFLITNPSFVPIRLSISLFALSPSLYNFQLYCVSLFSLLIA